MSLNGKPKITRFIAHILGEKGGKLILSDLPTPIGAGSNFPHDFFAGYIQYAMTDDKRRLACYQAQGGGKVAQAFAAFGSSDQSFVDGSHAMARHLEMVMRQSSYKGLIKPGDLMLALFHLVDESNQPIPGDGGAAFTYLAILKVKPSDAVLRHAQMVDGKRQVVFTSDERVPSPAEEHEIQKVAVLFDRRQTRPEAHDLVILDHNLKRTKVARFFHGDFLESELNRDAEETADRFIKKPRAYLARKGVEMDPPLKPVEFMGMLERGERVVRTRELVSPLEVASAVVSELPDREPEVLEALRTGLAEEIARHPRPAERIEPTQEVRVDTRRAAEEAEKRTYVLDQDVKIVGTSEALSAVVEIEDELDPEGRTVLTIRSHTFQVR